MPAADIDAYLSTVAPRARATLEVVRGSILALVPDAEQCISYSMPAFRRQGKVFAGFAAFAKHLSYLPHSGSVFPVMADDLAGYTHTTGSLHFDLGTPLPAPLVRRLVTIRLDQLGQGPDAVRPA